MTLTLAFYKGRGHTLADRFQDMVIRWATWSAYSHVELIVGQTQHGHETVCLSASGRDNGVRERVILLRPESWDLVELAIPQVHVNRAASFIRGRIGARYDLLGAVTSPWSWLPKMGRSDRWFCSEIIAAALGMEAPEKVSPQLLFEVATWGNPK